MTLQKTNLHLPPEVVSAFTDLKPADRDTYIVVLRNLEWTLQSIAEASGLTRERVRQIADTDETPAFLLSSLPLPTPPEVVVPEPKRVVRDPKPETLARLLELHPLAFQVRGNGTKYREEAEEFNRLLDKTRKPVEDGGEGVSLYRLSQLLPITHSGLRNRLGRYGYNGEQTVYKPVKEENRATLS